MTNHPNRNWRSKIQLKNYIADNYESQRDFAEKQEVLPQLVTKWLKGGYVVIDNVIYSPRRKLK